MRVQVFQPVRAETVRAAIGPDVAAMAAMLAQLDVVAMRLRAVPEHQHEFVLGVVEAAHATVGLVPDAQVQEITDAALPAAMISARWRQSMHTKAIAPGLQTSAISVIDCTRKPVNSLSLISPDAIANSRCCVLPRPQTWPPTGTLYGGSVKHTRCLLALYQGCVVVAGKRVATEQSVIAQQIEIAGMRDRRSYRLLRRELFAVVRVILTIWREFADNQINLRYLEASDSDVEIKLDERLKFDRQDLLVPASLLGKPVVGNDIGALSASLRWSIRIVGTAVLPSRRAAASRPCPARIVLASSIRIGLVKPNFWMLSAICLICAFECVRALRLKAISLSIGKRVVFSAKGFLLIGAKGSDEAPTALR